jgi:ribosomal protein S18 acetylase RimI-like enzyme
VSIRKASFPNNTKSIHCLLRYIDLSIYPERIEIENPDDQWFVYEEKGEVIGCVAARRSRGEIRHIAVLPNHRRKGIGSQLVNCTIEFLKDIGYSTIWAQVRVKNKESQGLFEKLGFKRKPRPIRSVKNPEVKLYKYVLTL